MHLVCFIWPIGGARMEEIGIYIHIPFCMSKCYYCDFISFPKLDNRIDEYIDYLIKEMDLYKEWLKEYMVKTIFIGEVPHLI